MAQAPSRSTELALQLLPAMLAMTALSTTGKASQVSALRRHPAAQSLLRRLAEAFVRPGVYWLFHSWRLFSYNLLVPPLLFKWPLRTMLGLVSYAAIHRQSWWQVAVHKLLGYGASRRHNIVNPSKHLIHDDKRYLWSLHPHSILADGWHSIIARNTDSFDDAGNGPPEIGRKIALCFAPVIQHVPVHQEMYRDKCGAADSKSVASWWKTPDTDPALIPGGFAESVFANAGDKSTEYAYIKDRKGFVRICVEEGKDIVPCYTFKSSWMYYNPGILKGLRARLSQKISLGLVAIIGRFGTSMPLRDDTTTVVFPPFGASAYRPEQFEDAHAAYLEHLKFHFDLHKATYGMEGVNLVFVGKDYQDDDFAARALRRIGILSGQVTKTQKAALSDAPAPERRRSPSARRHSNKAYRQNATPGMVRSLSPSARRPRDKVAIPAIAPEKERDAVVA
mmetsp:Transcript_76971/g.220481  ORF Transcript_76971/g.220481 Transcript_76971/m.220481 type:complete len:450 (+) Transcript_76971:122-1471(+)